MAAYNSIIYLISSQAYWEAIDHPIKPPYKKQAGRPKMKRVKEFGENK